MKLSCPSCGSEDVFEANYDTLLEDPKRCPKCGVMCEVEYDESVNDDGDEMDFFGWQLLNKKTPEPHLMAGSPGY